MLKGPEGLWLFDPADQIVDIEQPEDDIKPNEVVSIFRFLSKKDKLGVTVKDFVVNNYNGLLFDVI